MVSILHPQKHVENEELCHGIESVDDFHKQIAECQVVTIQLTTEETTMMSQYVFQSAATTSL